MANINHVFLLGNLTRDVDCRYTPKGTAVAEIGLAINRRYTAESGEKWEEVTFVDVTLWGRNAEIANEYLKKGNPVLIEGRLQLDSWDDKETGQKRYKLKVVGESIQLMGGKREDKSDDRPKDQPTQQSSKPPIDPELAPEEDDIPF